MTTQSSLDSRPVVEKVVIPVGVARRRLLRAGLSAAPVLAALKSNTVLAGDHTCIRPSSFSSLAAANMKASQGRIIKSDYSCYSHGYWKNNDTGLPAGFKSTKFIGASPSLGFTANPGGAYTNKTLQDVLDYGGNDNLNALARHIVGTYLTAKAYGDGNGILTLQQCANCWNSGGVWSPFAGANWTLVDTMTYFNTIYGAKFAI